MLPVLIMTIVLTVYGNTSRRTEFQCSYWEDRHFNLHANCSKRNFTSIPVVLSGIVSLDLSGNRIKVVHNKTFLKLSHLWELNLSFNRIEWLEIGTFSGLESLQVLILRKNGLAYNSRHFSKSIFKPLKFLTYLDISLQRGWFEERNSTWFSQFVISDLTNLQSIEIDIFASTTDYVFREGFLSLSKLKKVKAGYCVMNANEKAFVNIPHVDQIDITDCVINSYAVGTFSGRQVKYLNLSSTNPQLAVWSNILQDFKRYTINTLVLTDTLEALRKMWEHLVFDALNKTDLQKLFLNQNEIQKFCLSCQVHDFDLPLTLKYLDLSSNKLICFCLSMPHLSSLNLQHNNLRDYFRSNTYYPSHPTNMTVINFAFNNLDYLNVSIFHGHQRLRVLNLSNNYLTDIDFDISHLTLLEVLDLSNNRIQKFSEKSMKKLNVLFDSSNVKVNLGGNVLQCSCDDISFIEWLLDKHNYFSAKHDTKCKFGNGTSIFLTEFRSTMLQLKENCASRLVLIICISIAITSMLIIAIIGIQQNASVDETQDERIFALERTIKKLETIVENVTKSKDKSEKPVMFYAKISGRSFTFQMQSTVVFETVILNIGGHYDQYDGIFVAPRKGVYMFSWTVSIGISKYVVTELVVEDKIISGTGNTDTNGGHHSASMTALCRMDKDEHAFIRTASYSSANVFYSYPNYPQTSFLGMLVFDEK
ncbi:unnamed protein product [Mytilus coruscus]|uniref:C1q domain-containing protein n=1 Tax=Mytilus coruscus TaxID=42192 RepID=A0A6J8AVX2_MYTCO|nr:unnamed protein product [Mytilus coruscus]